MISDDTETNPFGGTKMNYIRFTKYRFLDPRSPKLGMKRIGSITWQLPELPREGNCIELDGQAWRCQNISIDPYSNIANVDLTLV